MRRIHVQEARAGDRAASAKLQEALRAGDLGGAYTVIHQLDPDSVPAVMLYAGFSVGTTLKRRAFLLECQAQLSAAARHRVDGFGLRALLAGSPSDVLSCSPVPGCVS